MKKENIILTISILVSNRIDTIRKCMESLKPLLDAVPSELIAVDTVGEEHSDGSVAVVREYTDKIIRFEWCNDFAAARNTGLNAAKGEWFLFLDDDEWFEDVKPMIQFFLSGDYKNYDRGWYYARNYLDKSGTHYLDTLVDRMCVITPETRFEGRIHEYVYPLPSKVMQFSNYVHHYGYAYENDEAKMKHFERNMKLMLLELQEHPQNVRMVGQIAQEYVSVNQFAEAEAVCRQWLIVNGAPETPFAEFLVVMLIRSAVLGRTTEEAEESYKEWAEKYPLSEFARLAVLVEGTTLDLRRKAYQEALEKAKEYFDLKKKIQKRWEESLVQMVFDLKRYVSEEIEEQMIQFGLAASAGAKDSRYADIFLDRVVWTDEKKRPYGIMMHLIEFYGKSGADEVFFPCAEKILKNQGMKKQFMVALEGLCREYPERKEAVQNWLRELQAKERSKPAMNAEMQQLVVQLKKNVEVLMAAGKVEEAEALLTEMKQLLGQ